MPLSQTPSPPEPGDDAAWLAVIERGTTDPRIAGEMVEFGDYSALVVGTELRYVCLGERELLRRVHVAVRDGTWDTIPASSERATLAEGEHGPELRAEVEHVRGEVDFAWQGSAGAEGRVLRYSMSGVCGSDFDFNRIGICAMLPLAEFAGAEYSLEGPDGSHTGRLPQHVGPQSVVGGIYHGVCPPFRRFAAHLADGTEVTLAFSGEDFEMEDQRNWTDASFKVYSTPLARPFPQRASRGTPLRQSLDLSVRRP